jgi:hypothetical protein
VSVVIVASKPELYPFRIAVRKKSDAHEKRVVTVVNVDRPETPCFICDTDNRRALLVVQARDEASEMFRDDPWSDRGILVECEIVEWSIFSRFPAESRMKVQGGVVACLLSRCDECPGTRDRNATCTPSITTVWSYVILATRKLLIEPKWKVSPPIFARR